MLSRCVFTVWASWLVGMALATVLNALRVCNPNPIVPIGLAVLMFGAGFGLVIAAPVRLIRGPRRDRAFAGLLLGMAPFWFLAGHILLAVRPAIDRHVPPGWPSRVLQPVARPLVDLGARWLYTQRTFGKRVTMIGTPADDARAQVAAMDKHVDRLLARLGQSKAWPIVWYRGSLFGLQWISIYDMAIGSPVGSGMRGADGLADLDRHEVAHCVLTASETPRSDPPRLLIEGWAQANQGTPAEELADTAWRDHKNGWSLPLRQLVAPDWYWYSGPAAYNQGAALVNYLLRVYGPERFLKLYTTCQQPTFESDVRACLGLGLDELDAAYWADVERLVRTGPPARRWLKNLKRDPGVDPAAWDAFLADYFAAADRLVAPFDHVRLRATFRETVTDHGRIIPDHQVDRLTLVRSGPFALVRIHSTDPFRTAERWILAHPDHPLQVRRELAPKPEPWANVNWPRPFPLQVYQDTLDRVEATSGNFFYDATHGGAALLVFPKILTEVGLPTDYEVAELDSTTRDGHRFLTLRLRPGPEMKKRDPTEYSYVFDADDRFVVRSMHSEGPITGVVANCQLTYDHPEGHPVLRSSITKIPKQNRTLRVDVDECRFGPIPESEFALEPFLTSLGPDRPAWEPLVEPSAAPLVACCWAAFVGGATSIAGGASMCLRSRSRDRQVVCAE